MSYGFKAYDESGNISIDITDRLTRLYGTYSVSAPTAYSIGTYNISGISPATHFAFVGEIPAWVEANTVKVFNSAYSAGTVFNITIFSV
jgi:hypothetical protein